MTECTNATDNGKWRNAPMLQIEVKSALLKMLDNHILSKLVFFSSYDQFASFQQESQMFGLQD